MFGQNILLGTNPLSDEEIEDLYGKYAFDIRDRLQSLVDMNFGHSRRKFAKAVGIRYTTVDNWFKEKPKPTIPAGDKLMKICLKLGLPAEWLLLGRVDYMASEFHITAPLSLDHVWSHCLGANYKYVGLNMFEEIRDIYLRRIDSEYQKNMDSGGKIKVLLNTIFEKWCSEFEAWIDMIRQYQTGIVVEHSRLDLTARSKAELLHEKEESKSSIRMRLRFWKKSGEQRGKILELEKQIDLLLLIFAQTNKQTAEV